MTCFRFLKVSGTAVACAFLSACFGYVPGAKSYWDAKVKELCLKDGGVVVYERVTLTPDEYRQLGGSRGAIPVYSKSTAKPGSPYVAEIVRSVIHDWGPEVLRHETSIVRVADSKVLSKQIDYSRIGGDMPSPSHPSSYSCKDVGIRLDVERQTFNVSGPTE